ncbi:co-regulatory protein PtrA N-terminal domain-containing protein, partial [Klebsiella pneumoniae]
MNRLKALFFVSSILISASALAEGGADRILERMESLRDKAEATLVQAEKA